MTPDQVKHMKAHRGVWMNHERAKPRAIAALGLSDLMWAFEVGHSMALGIPIREAPPWGEQPDVKLNARVKENKEHKEHTHDHQE